MKGKLLGLHKERRFVPVTREQTVWVQWLTLSSLPSWHSNLEYLVRNGVVLTTTLSKRTCQKENIANTNKSGLFESRVWEIKQYYTLRNSLCTFSCRRGTKFVVKLVLRLWTFEIVWQMCVFVLHISEKRADETKRKRKPLNFQNVCSHLLAVTNCAIVFLTFPSRSHMCFYTTVFCYFCYRTPELN